ncbi:MAG: TRAP transporter small permease [Rhodobacteraceae bacterium]|nr:TRAP transporter small permease [Paracoccaceae bacterium]
MTNLLLSGASRISKIANAIATGANVVGTLVVLALVIVVNFDVVARGVFSAPFLGAVEVVQFSMVLIVFLQLPDVVRVNRLTRSDGFLVVLGNRRPRIARAIGIFVDGVAALFLGVIAYAIWPEFLEMFETKDYFGIPGVFTAPWWPIKLTIFLSAVLCTLLFILKVLLPSEKAVGGSRGKKEGKDT